MMSTLHSNEVDLVGQPADAEHHHHDHHHLDDLLGKVKVKVKHDFTAPLLSRIERRGEEMAAPPLRSIFRRSTAHWH